MDFPGVATTDFESSYVPGGLALVFGDLNAYLRSVGKFGSQHLGGGHNGSHVGGDL
jgi:hypothetical protein